ncbi:hypothetical protein KO361_04810 [Candidatus Woesearchaeota archaeon]|nr:hypothetical protein [Candidatus Woesearchaeota archaeon]
MTTQILLLILLFPLAFITGKFITKNSEEEIQELRNTTIKIMKIFIILTAYLTIKETLSEITSLIITALILTSFLLKKQSIQEKIIISLIASTAIFYELQEIIILGLISIFLKGINTQEEKEKLVTKKTMLQVTLIILTISIKFLILYFFAQ